MYIFNCFKSFVHENENVKIQENLTMKENMKVKESQDWFNKTFIVGNPACKSVQINVKPVEDDVQVSNDKFLKTSPNCEKSHRIGLAQHRKRSKLLKVPGSAQVPKCSKSSYPGTAVSRTGEVQRKALVSVVDLKSISRS